MSSKLAKSQIVNLHIPRQAQILEPRLDFLASTSLGAEKI